jgi:hypothetical protein
MMDFKFFQKPKPIPIQPSDNMYLMFNMDDALINVIRWKQYHNIDILSGIGTELAMVNIPIVNCWLTILSWVRNDSNEPHMVEINYSVMEANTTARNYTFRMDETEFIRRIDITGV